MLRTTFRSSLSSDRQKYAAVKPIAGNLRYKKIRRALKYTVWIIAPILYLGLLVQPVAAQGSSGAWEPTGSMMEARTGAAAALLPSGRVLITGGDGALGPLSGAELYDTDGGFSAAAPMHHARSRHASTVLRDGRVLVTGGMTTGGGVSSSAEVYDYTTNSWSIVGTMAEARSGHTATLLKDGRVLITGGGNSLSASSTLEIFDPATNGFSSAGVLSSPRKNHAAARLSDGRVLIVGGSNGITALASVDIYDPSTGLVFPGTVLSTARAGLSATTLLNGNVLVTGGNNGSSDLATAEVYDAAAGTFSPTVGGLAVPRRDHLAFLLPNNNHVLIVSGTSAGTPPSDVELFRAWASTFISTGSLLTPRAAAAGSALNEDGKLLVAGGSGLSSAEVYRFATVKTDKDDYAPGEIVTITGSGWQPGETVSLLLEEKPKTHDERTLTSVADASGNIFNNEFSPEEHDVGVRFYLTATGAASQAQTTFTDAQCTNDLQGPDDEPGQKDLNQFCAGETCGTGRTYTWNFDDTNWSGGNTGDSCALFDTDGDGNANRAVCVTVTGNAQMQSGNPKCYTCSDGRPDRCTNSVATTCTSTCTVTLASDPFTGQHTGGNPCNAEPGCLTLDAMVTCCIQPGDDGGDLIDVCAYPSQVPNSDPSDCVVTPPACKVSSDCDDNNACTVDECVSGSGPAFCRNTPGNAGAVCRPSAGTCDVAEVCTGTSNACPADGFATAATECRAAAGECDVAESCTGTSASCPTDAKQPSGTICTDDGNVCTTDQCNGTSDDCQHPAGNAGAVCRASAGDCDVAETCTGTSPSCPDNGFQAAGSACGSQDDSVCDNPDTCDSNGACQANNESTTTVCRADAGDCDIAETCAPGGVCPADTFEPAGTACGSDADTVCDNPDTCNASGACQQNNEPTTFVCRPDAGDCDIAETCAPGGVCPADTFEPAGTACGSDADTVCDNPDTCNASGACQQNNEPTTFVCRPDAGDCDIAETCAPGGVCPGDALEPAGTSCSDQNACTTGDACSPSGQCVGGAPPNCNDNNECTADSCDPQTGCVTTPTPGTSCSDENACTTNDTCSDTGQCVGGPPPDCNDQNACTVDSCDPTMGCINTPAPTATGCEGKMTGGGQMDAPNGQNASFGFNAQIKNGVSSGHFNYVNHVTRLHINGKVELIYFVDAATRTIKFRGTDSKTGCQFDVTVTDTAEPGANQDRFGLTTTCAESQTYRPIRRGNLQWHPT